MSRIKGQWKRSSCFPFEGTANNSWMKAIRCGWRRQNISSKLTMCHAGLRSVRGRMKVYKTVTFKHQIRKQLQSKTAEHQVLNLKYQSLPWHVSVTTLSDSRWALASLHADCRSVTLRGRACWEVGHCQHRLPATHMLHQHPVCPQETFDVSTKNQDGVKMWELAATITVCWVEVQQDDSRRHFTIVVFPHERLHRRCVETFLVECGWPDDGSPAKSILGWWSETEQLCWKQSGQFPRRKKKKKLLRINVCVLCWEVWFTHMAAEETCCSEGDSVVLPEHNC